MMSLLSKFGTPLDLTECARLPAHVRLIDSLSAIGSTAWLVVPLCTLRNRMSATVTSPTGPPPPPPLPPPPPPPAQHCPSSPPMVALGPKVSVFPPQDAPRR